MNVTERDIDYIRSTLIKAENDEQQSVTVMTNFVLIYYTIIMVLIVLFCAFFMVRSNDIRDLEGNFTEGNFNNVDIERY